MAKVLFTGEVDRAPIPFPFADPAKDSIVGTDEELIRARDQNRFAIRTNARIYHGNMNGAGRKVSVATQEVESPCLNILRRNLVSDVDNAGVRIDGKDHTFHRAGKIVLSAKVSQESDD